MRKSGESMGTTKEMEIGKKSLVLVGRGVSEKLGERGGWQSLQLGSRGRDNGGCSLLSDVL